jgi:ectoine hydroxylase-related dioxygenase (phytanoyl-CoA dioxygenase family)
VDTRVAKPPYLWFFVCLDDTTPQNGATWVVPGSHHVSSPEISNHEQHSGFAAPIAQRLCGSAGDLLVLDPTALHGAGVNTTDRPRRLINVGVCSAATPPLMDHWSIAGPRIQPRVSDRVRDMMRSGAGGLDRTWDALPQEWRTG